MKDSHKSCKFSLPETNSNSYPSHQSFFISVFGFQTSVNISWSYVAEHESG